MVGKSSNITRNGFETPSAVTSAQRTDAELRFAGQSDSTDNFFPLLGDIIVGGQYFATISKGCPNAARREKALAAKREFGRSSRRKGQRDGLCYLRRGGDGACTRRRTHKTDDQPKACIHTPDPAEWNVVDSKSYLETQTVSPLITVGMNVTNNVKN